MDDRRGHKRADLILAVLATRISRVFSTTPTAYTPTAMASATTSVRPRCSHKSIRTFAQGVVSNIPAIHVQTRNQRRLHAA